MVFWRSDKWLRIGAGVGLLLVAAQEKLCPWLANPPPDPIQAKAPPKRQLPYLQVDTAAPRRPAACLQSAARDAEGRREGIVSRGPQESSAVSIPAPPVDLDVTWHALARLDGSRIDVVASPVFRPLVHNSLATSILRTGPPRV